MLHPIHNISAGLNPQPITKAEAIDSYARLGRCIERSNQSPYRSLALALGIFTTAILALLAACLRALNQHTRPDLLDCALAESYFHVPEMAIHKKIELDALIQAGISGATIDLGCGSGIVGALLKKHSSITYLHGIDQTLVFADETKLRGYDDYTVCDVSQLTLGDSRFDSAVSICVLEHVEKIDGALAEARRVLKPSGHLYFTTPAPEFRKAYFGYRWRHAFGLHHAAEKATHAFDLMGMHFHYRDENKWRMCLKEIGFDEVSIRPIFSRTQLLIYDILNYSVRLPTFYFADKVYVFGQKHRMFAKASVWTTKVLTAYVSRLPVNLGCHTHWLIIARCAPVIVSTFCADFTEKTML